MTSEYKSVKRPTNHFWNLVNELILNSEKKYKSGDYKGAIEDKRRAKFLIQERSEESTKEKNFRKIIKESKQDIDQYDLIQDFKLKIENDKVSSIINSLEDRSEKKYKIGDYRGAIIALRRAERYY